MLRYSILVLSAVLAISAAASAEINVTIGLGQNGYYPNQYPYNQSPAYYPNPGYYPNQGYVNYNGCPPGHYYCNTHRRYCNHPQNGYYGDRDDHHHRGHKNRGRWNWRGNNQGCRR